MGKPTQKSRRGQEAHPKIRERSGAPPGGLEGFGRPIRRSGCTWTTRRTWMGREANSEVRDGSEAHLKVREAHP